MLEAVSAGSDRVTIRATVRRCGVYLDNHSIIALAKGNAERRNRILRSFEMGADLMFSPVNAAEIIGPEYQSSLLPVRAFLDGVGPHWFPVEGADVMEVIRREAAGADRPTACTSSWFLNQVFAGLNIFEHGEQRFEVVEPKFFRLSFVLDWLHPQRADIRRRLSEFDDKLLSTLGELRRGYERNPRGFEELLPQKQYDERRPATFAFESLLRGLVYEAKAFQLKKGDGADLCHAVTASAFANFATLDKHWKRRVCGLPKPNGLAKIYYEPELDRLVTDVEDALRNSATASNRGRLTRRLQPTAAGARMNRRG